jgi:glycosyltransferase involved in cell wall biosynthesis
LIPRDHPKWLSSGTGNSPRQRLLIVGGPDVHLRVDLMRALANRYQVAAAGSNPMHRDTFTRAGFPFYSYPLARGVNPSDELRSLFALERLVRSLEPTIVHTFATKPSVWGRIAARRAGVRGVLGTLPGLGSLYSSSEWTHRVSRRVYEGLQKYASDCSDMTVFQNAEDLAHFRSAGIVTEANSTLVAGSGVATDYFDPEQVPECERAAIASELGLESGSIVVTMVSRVMRTKGVMEFANMADVIRHRHPYVRFLLVGPDDHESIGGLSDAERRKLNASVRWLGHRSDIRAILAISHVFALPTFYREGMPRSLLEAASMAIPLVTTRVPGCEDVVVHEECGVLVPPRDSRALAAAVEALVCDHRLRQRLGEAARRRVLERFSLTVVADRTAELYERILRTPSASSGAPSWPRRRGAEGRRSHYPSPLHRLSMGGIQDAE